MNLLQKLFRVRVLVVVYLVSITVQISSAFAVPVEISDAPDNNLALTINTIKNVKQSLLLNIYDLSSPQIADALIERINAGVDVAILEEGQPVGGLSAAAKGIQAKIVKAMEAADGDDHFYEMTSKTVLAKRRFRFDHAKYAVIDAAALLIGSENYSPTGNPVSGTLGNRGWEVLVHDSSLAKSFSQIFAEDSSTSSNDVIELTNRKGKFSVTAAKPKKPALPSNSPGKPGETYEASQVMQITSPDTSLNGLLALINNAKTSIDIEQMTFDSGWKPSGTNPLTAAVAAAAKRGVRIRVLLNDESVFSHGKPTKSKNQPTVDYFNQMADQSNLDIEARIADVKAMHVDYIHNKGMLIDGELTLISSINWDENAIEHNREAAVAVTSPDIFSYYESLFDSDWQASADDSKKSSKQFNFTSDALSFNCPSAIRANIQIGILNISNEDDESFAMLSNKKISSDFIREENAGGCILSAEKNEITISKHEFIQIRKASDGSFNITFEAYTPKSNKLYSVRTSVDVLTDGVFDARVFGGTKHKYLGSAEIGLAIKE